MRPSKDGGPCSARHPSRLPRLKRPGSHLRMTDQAAVRVLANSAMNRSTLENKDVWAGLFLIVVGVVAVVIARNYTFGTALRMGPGFFPTILGGFLVLSGLYILANGLRSGEAIEGSWPLRALIVLPLALVLFGVLIERAGFVPAMLVLIFGSGLAGTEFRLIEMLIFSVLLTALCAIVFVWALGLPYPLIAGF